MKKIRFTGVVLLLTLTISFLPIPAPAASKQPVRAKHGIVASSSDIASQVGIDVMKAGGNAVDAAVAVGLALAVTHPAAGNIGGGGFMVVRMADGRTTTFDYRETAPKAASHDMYLDKDGKEVKGLSTVGYKAVGVPGTVAGFSMALEKFGTKSWKDVVEPARKLAANGFTVSYDFAAGLRRSRKLLEQFPESKRIFLNDGMFYEWGDTFKQPELAATFARLQEKGPREFYEGKTAEMIAADMKANGGLITLEDLKNYKAIERKPLTGTYRGYEIITMPPPSSGGPALLEMLNMLENYDVAKLEYNSSDKYHLMIETMRRAFADRAEFLGDPAFVDVPTKGLTSKAYAKELTGTIKMDAATPSSVIGHGKPAVYESDQTTHYTVVDAEGNVVTQTYTLNFGYGCGATVKGAGFLLNDEMDDLAAKPGSPNGFGLVQGEANSVQPGKRPLSSMTPTIVLDKEHKLWFAIGSPGGPTIINTVLQVIVNIIDHKMNIQQAIDAPRIHHQWLPDLVQWEPYGLSPDVMKALKAKGHQFQDRPSNMGDAEGIMIDPETGIRLGAADPRADGKAVGY
ncbi:MAG TPA: gamma-glutamyltransferase [Blastocatellia bacterium]|nr:gamma-glutamyltransferase [Blastocatellia bacterium]